MSSLQLVTYQHTAAVVEYKPAVDVEQTLGWHTECDKEVPSRLAPPWFNVSDCIGDSRRLTRRQGASASFTIYGNSITLFGSMTGGPFSVRIGDGREEVREPETAISGVLFAAEGLESGSHRVTLTSTGENTELRFTRVEFDAGVRSNWTKTTIGAREVSAWTFSEGWVKMNNPILGSDSQPVEVQTGYQTVTVGAVAFLKFQGNAIWIFGNVMAQHSGFAVTLMSPKSPVLPATTQTGNFNSLSNYTVAGALMYFAGGLDPRVEQFLSITVLNAAQPGFDLIRAEIVTGDPPVIGPPSTTSTPSLIPTSTPKYQSINTPRIIGAAIGGILVGLACAVLIYYLKKRHRSKRYAQKRSSVDLVEFRSPRPHSQTTDRIVPIFLPSSGQSNYNTAKEKTKERFFGKANSSSDGSLPALTLGGSTSARIGTNQLRPGPRTLPPAYSARGSSDHNMIDESL